MKKVLIYLNLFLLLVSCGAAKNSDSRKDDTKPQPTNPNLQALDSEKLQGSMRSLIYRNRGSVQMNYVAIAKTLAAGNLPATHREIPDMDQDLDINVIRPNKLPLPETDCGNQNDENISINARRQDCKTKQLDELALLWNGKNQANSGEGEWVFVTNSTYKENNKSYNKQVWLDLSTGQLWSDVLSDADWRIATGADGFDADRTCQAKSDAPKHELGRIHPKIVKWRLPNRNDFLQADLNGSRFVLPNNNEIVWTSSYAGNNQAWAINISTGVLELHSIDDKLKVRCIGVVIK